MDKKQYKQLTIPKVAWNRATLSERYGEFEVHPLEPGFGITLGNAIRRALLGGVEGSAVTAVIVHGVNNEFTSLDGVEEDTMQLLLNIKQLIIGNSKGIPGKMYLKTEKPGPVYASDIKPDEHLEVINKDHVIAHIAEGGSLEITFTVGVGRGFLPAQWPEDKPLQEDGMIYLDAMFSPVRQVSFDVQKTRVGKEIDYDKLVLQVATDGSDNPVSVVNYAASVLRAQLEHLIVEEIPFNQIAAEAPEVKKERSVNVIDLGLKGVSPEFLLKPIDELELSVRAHNCLMTAGKKRIIDLINQTEDDMLQIKNLGRKSLTEVKESLNAFGLSLGMNIDEADIKRLVKV